MSSFFRLFKLIKCKDVLYDHFKLKLIAARCKALADEANELRNNSIEFIKGNTMTRLPIDHILESFVTFQPTLKLQEMTTLRSHEFFVQGYADFRQRCLWPAFADCVTTSMQHVFSLANLRIFKANFDKVMAFQESQQIDCSVLLMKFDLNSYSMLLSQEQKDLIIDITAQGFSRKVTAQSVSILTDYYIHEIGDRLVQLVVQLFVAHLNAVVEIIDN